MHKEFVPADLVSALLAKRRNSSTALEGQPLKLPAKIYGVMTATALLTFTTLTQGYELFFARHPFA